jgi:uncharacterized membrane protein YraQ (UPF0718 family)
MENFILYAVVAVLLVSSLIKDRTKTRKALTKGLKAFEGILPEFLVVVMIVAIVLAVFDPVTISRLIGVGSGWIGIMIASLVGAITLIPGFVAFPAAAELLRNGAGVTQIAAFVSSLMMVGVVTLPLEIRYFGKKAAIGRNVLAFVFSIVAALFVGWMVAR